METKDYGHGITTQITEDGMLAIVWENGKTKKFRGETAWMDAERYAQDLVFKVIYA
jgi:hypothetical protein